MGGWDGMEVIGMGGEGGGEEDEPSLVEIAAWTMLEKQIYLLALNSCDLQRQRLSCPLRGDHN